jgi:hypothetical protein
MVVAIDVDGTNVPAASVMDASLTQHPLGASVAVLMICDPTEMCIYSRLFHVAWIAFLVCSLLDSFHLFLAQLIW